MGYDTGAPIEKEIIYQEDPAQREAALKDYGQKVQALKDEIPPLEAQLDHLNGKIAEREAELKRQYATETRALGKEIDEAKAYILALREQIAGLEEDVKARAAERDSILLDFFDEHKKIDAKIKEFDTTVANTIDSQRANEKEAERLSLLSEQIAAAAASFEDHAQKTKAALEAKQSKLDGDLIKNEQSRQSLQNTLARTNYTIKELNNLRQQTSEEREAAMALVIKAEQVKADLIFISQEKEALKARQIQLDEDAAQIGTARLALDTVREELDQRAATVKEAERKLGGVQ